MTDQHYASPGAFRRALSDRLRTLAASTRWELPQLQRQIAHDRLLARLYASDSDWIVKGATALVARGIGVRGTIDIDVYRDLATDAAASELRSAATQDIRDWFRFEVHPPQPVADGAPGVRLPVDAYVGETKWAAFHVDVVGSELRMTGTPEEVAPLAGLEMPDIEQRPYRVYPLADHIADKIAATFQRYGPNQAPSTRFKDLVDLVALVTSVTVPASDQLAALRSEAGRRGIVLPSRFGVPDRAMWEPGYAAEARRSLLDVGLTLDGALAIVSPFADALLSGGARGHWIPAESRWGV